MPLSFPLSPTIGDVYSFGGKSWEWNGEGWQSANTPTASGPTFPIDSLFLIQQSLSLTDTDALTNTEVQYI